MTSSCDSIHDTSTSTLTNSVSWRVVSSGLARNTGPISKTRSKPAHMAICLENWGDWARYAGRSK